MREHALLNECLPRKIDLFVFLQLRFVVSVRSKR